MFEDLLEARKELIKSIIRNIEIFSETNKEHKTYTLALYGKYGTGKTYFLNSLQNFIEGEHEDFDFKNNFKILKINAWQDDVLNNPILSIGLSILDSIDEKNIKKSFKDTLSKFTTIATKVGKNSLPVIGKSFFNLLLDKLYIKEESKEIIKEIKDACLNKDFLEQLQQNNIDEEYKNYKKYIQNIQNVLGQYIESLNKNQKNTKLLIIVDELDRCRPDYAVEFLEAINHIYDVENMVFLIAVDDNNLKSSMKVVYGLSMDFDSYIKKFFDYHFDLRNVDNNIDLKKYIKNKIKEADITNKIYNSIYIKIAFGSYPTFGEKEFINYISYLFIDLFKLNLREINYAFRFIEYYFNEELDFLYVLSLMFLICLKTKNNEIYKKLFDNQTNDIVDININILGNFLKNINFSCRLDKEYNIKNFIGLCIFNNISCANGSLNKEYNDEIYNKIKSLNYENYKYIFDKEFFDFMMVKDENNEKSNEYPKIMNLLHNINYFKEKSILRQCFEMLY